MRGLDSLHVHECLQAREKDHARALASDCADGSKHPSWVLCDVGMLSAHHKDHHNLTKCDEDATKDGSLLWREELEDDTWKDAKQGECVQHEVEPVKNFITDLVLLLQEVEVSIKDKM